MGSTIGNVGRALVIGVVGLLMIPAGLGLLGCTMCAATGGGIAGTDRVGFAIGAVVCLAILVGGVFVIGKLSKQMGTED
jgi:hypothetical protein